MSEAINTVHLCVPILSHNTVQQVVVGVAVVINEVVVLHTRYLPTAQPTNQCCVGEGGGGGVVGQVHTRVIPWDRSLITWRGYKMGKYQV